MAKGSFDPHNVSVPQGHLIDGTSVSNGQQSIPVIRPSDRQVHAELPVASTEDVDAAVDAAKKAFPAWRDLAPRERAARLLAWADLAQNDTRHLAELESLVSARIFHETLSVDVPAAIGWIRFYAEYADKIDGRVTSSTSLGTSLVVNEPYGVVAAIAPWNFPLVLATWKIAPAIAAGNCVVVKPSEFTPYSITRLAHLALEAGIPPGVINVVHGWGHDAGATLVKHPDVSYVTFTGSTRTGAQIMADAAMHGLKPVSLELGGKGPQLVMPDVSNLDEVARDIAWGITRNAGQLCYAGSRLVVHDSIEPMLIEKVQTLLQDLNAGPTWSEATTLAPIINETQQSRMQAIVKTTIEEGAECVCGGNAFENDLSAFYFEPTILRALTTDMRGYREEIFGPVLGVQTFHDIDEGIALANHPIYGLSASIYTQDINTAFKAARSIHAGTVWVNTWGRKADMTAPFGGMNQSGFGREAGKDGIEKFLRSKAIWIDQA